MFDWNKKGLIEEVKELINKIENSKEEDIEWITIKGNHIPVKKGQSKEEAVKEFIESKKEDDELVTVKKGEYNKEKAEKRYAELKGYVKEMKEKLTSHDITEKDAEILKSRIEGREKQIKELEEEYKNHNKGEELKLDKDKLDKVKKDTDFVRSLLGKADNSLTNTIAEAMVEVIAENCGE